MASKFTTVLEDVNRSNNENAWMRLLNFPRPCFKVLGRGGRRWNLARLVNQQLAEECDPTSLDNTVPNACPPGRRAGKSQDQSDPFRSLATRVSTKLEEGDFRGAVCLACSEDSVAALSDGTMPALRASLPF